MSGAVRETRAGRWLAESAPARLVVGYLSGVLAARLFGVVGPLSVGGFALTLSAVAMPVLFWTAAKLAVRPRAPDRERTRRRLAVASGVVADELVYLAFRPDGVGYWDPLSLAGTVVMSGAVLALVAALSVVGREGRDGEQPPTPGRWLPVASGAAVVVAFVGYRASQLYLRAQGVPNEKRSVVVAGYEIHHVSTGSVLLVLAAVALASPGIRRRWHRVAALAAAVGCGFVADEYPYVFYPEMTDALYFGPVSAGGATLVTAGILAALAYHAHRAQETRNDD